MDSQKNLFLFWHKPENEMPIFHKMNLRNIRERLTNTDWHIILTNLDRSSPYYIENYIELPSFFFDICNRMNDEKGIYGNQSDMVRLRLLEKYGGCYFDTSTILLRDDISQVRLYNKFLEQNSHLAGYTNVTFTRKKSDGTYYYPEAKDGIELGALFARKNSTILSIFNHEIEDYWNWKKKNVSYTLYPPFVHYGLEKNSFLNEYHVHYAIYHLILVKYPTLLDSISTQSMHMRGKENSVVDGPYSIQDRFCRGQSSYENASSKCLLRALLPGDMQDFSMKNLTFTSRIKLFLNSDLLIFPGYIRRDIEDTFKCEADFRNKASAFQYFYKFSSL